jgi:hypothetical protein
MKRLFKWLLPFLILVEIVLFRFDVIDFRSALLIAVLFEIAILAMAARQVVATAQAYGRNRRAGQDGWTALTGGLETFVPNTAARAITIEIQMWYYLGKWLFRKNHRSENEFTYHRNSRLMALAVIMLFVTPAEVLLLALLIPWAWLDWVLGIAAVYALFWIVAVYVSMAGRPHKLGETALFIHSGVLSGGEIPYLIIESAALTQSGKGSGDGLKVYPTEKEAFFSIGGEVNIKIYLREPVTLDNWIKKTAPVTAVFLAADEPEKMLAALQKRLAPLVQPKI